MTTNDIDAIRQQAALHHMELHPTGTVEWLRNRVNELTAERDNLEAYNRAVKGANDDLRAQLAEVRAKFQDALWTAGQHAANAKELTVDLAAERARTQETHQ